MTDEQKKELAIKNIAKCLLDCDVETLEAVLAKLELEIRRN